MDRKLVAFACLLVAATWSVPLPVGTNPVDTTFSDLGSNYTVLYDGPAGRHVQFGEPGRAVKGFYTFFDSRGKKQKVTYEADARGYRVKATVAVTESDQIAAASTTTTRRTAVAAIASVNKPKEREPEHVKVNLEPITELEAPVALEFQLGIVSDPLVPIKKVEKLLNDPIPSGHTGKIQFREPKTNHNFGSAYHLGYPFMSGNFIYAL